MKIKLLVNDDPWSIQEGTEIKRQWEKKLGISVELETATGDAFWAEKNNGTVTLTGIIAEYADVMAYLHNNTVSFIPSLCFSILRLILFSLQIIKISIEFPSNYIAYIIHDFF